MFREFMDVLFGSLWMFCSGVCSNQSAILRLYSFLANKKNTTPGIAVIAQFHQTADNAGSDTSAAAQSNPVSVETKVK